MSPIAVCGTALGTGDRLAARGSGLVWDICIWLRTGGEEERVLKYLKTKLNINYV